MISLVKLFDMYKAGEYIKDFSDDMMKYLAILDKVPEDIRNDLIRLDDKISKNVNLETFLALLVAGIFGAIIGYFVCDGWHSFHIALETLKQSATNSTVVP